MSLKTSSLPFKTLIDRQVHDQIMQKPLLMRKKLLAVIVKKWLMN